MMENSNLQILSCLPNYKKIQADPSSILSDGMIHVLTYYMPATLRLLNWKVLYTPKENGTSQLTFYDRLKGSDSTLIVLKDTKGFIFGGFCTEAW